MTMFNVSAPRLPTAPPEYDAAYLSQMLSILTLFFNQLNAVQPIMMAQLNIDLSTLPTEADLPTLRLGDVYRDTKDGVQATSQMLRIKTS